MSAHHDELPSESAAPRHIADDVHVGDVVGAGPRGGVWRIAVVVLSEVNYGYEPRVRIDLGPRRTRYLSDLWFLTDEEARMLAAWLQEASDCHKSPPR